MYYRRGGSDFKNVSAVPSPRLRAELYRLRQRTMGPSQLVRNPGVDGSKSETDGHLGEFYRQVNVNNKAHDITLQNTQIPGLLMKAN